MSLPLFFLNVVTVDDVVRTWQSIRPPSPAALLMFSALAAVTLVLVLWAVYLRKPRRRHSRHSWHHHASRPRPAARGPVNGPAAAAPGTPSRRRRSRRKHRRRNPTLAETGGLPAIRPDIPPAP